MYRNMNDLEIIIIIVQRIQEESTLVDVNRSTGLNNFLAYYNYLTRIKSYIQKNNLTISLALTSK